MTTRWITIYLLLLLTAPPLVRTAAAAPPDSRTFSAEIDECQREAPWICIELIVSANTTLSDDAVSLSYFIHDIAYATTYAGAYLSGIPRSMLTVSKDALSASLIIPAGTAARRQDEDATPFIIPAEITIQWEAGKNRTDIETTVTSVRDGVRTRFRYSTIVRPAVAFGALLGFVVDSQQHGPQYTGWDAARISVTTTRESQ